MQSHRARHVFCFLSSLLTALFAVVPLAAQDTPDPPINRDVGVVRLSSNQPGELNAAWDLPIEAPDDYRIRWAKVGESYLTWTDSRGNAFPTCPSYSITGLDEGVRYRVQVRPRYERGPRPWSDEVQIQIMASPATTSPPPTNTTLPPPTDTAVPPTNTPPPSDTPDPTIRCLIGAIQLTSNQPGVLTASWNGPEETPDDYRVSWAKVGEQFLTWTDSSGNAFPSSPSHTVTGLEGGVRYKVRARPRYDDGPRPWTNVFEIVVVAAPTATPIPPSSTPSATDGPRSEVPQNQGRSIQPRQQPTAAPTVTSTPTASATATVTVTATPTLTAQGQQQPVWPDQPTSQQLNPPKQSTATPTVEFVRQHGGTETHTPAPTNTPHPDRVALEAIYDALDGDDWTENDGWKTNRGLHNWHGVTVSGGRVTKLVLSNNSLHGSLPAAIGNLTELEELVLSFNQGTRNLRGAIPPEIGNLCDLKVLNLHYSNVTGSIPTEIDNLRNLEELNLSENELTGSIPSSFNNLRSVMTHLYLGSNSLTGSIPLYLLDFTELDTLHLNDNNFTGCIPNGLTRHVRVYYGAGAGVGLTTCTNTLTSTPVPTNTPVPTATLSPLTPTATPAPGFSGFSLSGQHQEIKVSYTPDTGVTNVRVFWRRRGQAAYQNIQGTNLTGGVGYVTTISGLQSDVAYEVYVQGYDDKNVALGRTSVKSVRIPKDLNVYGVRLSAGVNSLIVSWNTADHHSHYHIRWEREKGGGRGYDSGLEDNSYTIRGLEAGETYEAQVSVTDFDNGTGPWSAKVSGRARSGGAEPTGVAGPTVTQDGSAAQLNIRWNSPSLSSGDQLLKFELRIYDTNAGAHAYVTQAVPPDQRASPEPSYSREYGVSFDNTYRVAVRAQTLDGGWALWSNETSITIPPQTGAIDQADDYAPSRISAPTLSTSDTNTNNPKVGVAWTTPNTGATNPLLEYQLHYVSDNDSTGRSFNFSATGASNNAITAVNVIGLPVRRWYTFRLRARNASGFGAWSSTSRIYLPDSGGNFTPLPTFTRTPVPRAPGAPTDFTVWALTDDQNSSYVRFSWGDPADEGTSRISRFRVRYRWSGQDWIEVDRGPRYFFVLKSGDADYPAVYQRRYEFQVAAVSDDGQSLWSGSFFGTPLKAPDAVAEPTLVAGGGQLRVSWSRPDCNDCGITHYQLYYAENNANSSNSMTIERITGTSYTITGLTSGVEYKVAVRAVSSIGAGNWSTYAIGAPY